MFPVFPLLYFTDVAAYYLDGTFRGTCPAQPAQIPLYILVMDITESKMDLYLLTMLAQRQWNLDSLIPTLAPRLAEVHLCEGMRMWSGAGGRQLRHQYQGEVPFNWMRLWPYCCLTTI